MPHSGSKRQNARTLFGFFSFLYRKLKITDVANRSLIFKNFSSRLYHSFENKVSTIEGWFISAGTEALMTSLKFDSYSYREFCFFRAVLIIDAIDMFFYYFYRGAAFHGLVFKKQAPQFRALLSHSSLKA